MKGSNNRVGQLGKLLRHLLGDAPGVGFIVGMREFKKRGLA